jgi:hypothetical protein
MPNKHMTLQQAGILQVSKEKLYDQQDEVALVMDHLDHAILYLTGYEDTGGPFTPESLEQLKFVRGAAMQLYASLKEEIYDLEESYGDDIREAIGYGR